jgi:hypothetical protein
MKHKKPQIAKAVLSKKNNFGDATIPDFKYNYKGIVATLSWY